MKRLPLTYVLRTVKDFAGIPPEAIGSCLIDFAQWLAAMSAGRDLARRGKIHPPDDATFQWVDDGQHVLTATVTVDGRPVLVSTSTFADPEE